MNEPCPVCHDPYPGFHLEEPHAAAAARIPAHLVRRSNSAVRREKKAQRAA